MKETIQTPTQTPSTVSKFILAVNGVPAVEASYMGSRFLITYSKKAETAPWSFQDRIDTINQKSFGGLKAALGEIGMSVKFAGVGNGARSLELTVSEAAMAKYAGTPESASFVSQEPVLNDPPTVDGVLAVPAEAEPVAEIAPVEAVAEPVAAPVKKAKKAKKASAGSDGASPEAAAKKAAKKAKKAKNA